jgi:hypothetical protein
MEQWGDIEQKLQEASVDYLVFKDTVHANTKAIQESLKNVVCLPTPVMQPLKQQPKKEKQRKPKAHIDHKVNKEYMRAKAKRQREKLGIQLV